MMEELELALEPDKAKPQVGQLSDLGLVELTRHRQGQALAEVFAKKCPHCQGNGYIMEDIKYSSPTAEGEYRAKAAKMKLPLSGFKKSNNQKFNKNPKENNKQQQQEEVLETKQDIEITVQVENPSTVVQEDAEILEQNKKTSRNNKRGKFNKGKVKEIIKQEEVLETSENVLPQNAEIELDIEPKEPAKEVEKGVEKDEASVEVEQKEEAPKKTRRPNRGQGKSKSRKTAKKTTKDEE
jgi:ribonuclease E